MSCKWGSNFVFVGEEEYEEVFFNDKAKIMNNEELWVKTKEEKKVIKNDVAIPIPEEAYHIVVGGNLEGNFVFKQDCKSTIGCCFKVSSRIHLGNEVYAKAQFWDTAGQERYRTIGRSYYRGANIAIVVYDISQSSSGSIQNLDRWISEIRMSSEECTIILLGNKSDLERTVDFGEVAIYAEQNQIYFAEVSAKTGEGLTTAFARIFSASYMRSWSLGDPFEIVKFIVVGDSGVGKTTLIDRLEDFSVDLAPLAQAFPIDKEYRQLLIEEEKNLKDIDKNLIKKLIRKEDTNLISVNLGLLGGWTQGCEIATGDPELCNSCGSYYCALYTNDKTWTCLFCNEVNELKLEEEEIPRSNDVNYLETGTITSTTIEDDSVIVFCIDTSGSMTVTSPVSSQELKKLRKNKKVMPNLKIEGDSESQLMPSEQRGVEYISRLEAVQLAIDAQLTSLVHEHPTRRVILVTFSSDVNVYGDGSQVPIVIAGDHLSSEEYLSDISKWWNIENKENSSPLDPIQVIKNSRDALSNKLFTLQEGGHTALGPALLISCALAYQKPGSKVILCTDGIANVGIGSMETNNDYKNLYRNIAKTSLERNTTLSLMSFKDSESNIELLGEMATKTGGQVDMVDPANVNKNFEVIFQEDSVARDVTLKLFLSPEWRLKEETIIDNNWNIMQEKIDTYSLYIGSINSDSNLLIEFEPMHNTVTTEKVPFQFLLRYTRVDDGSKISCVISRQIPITYKREESEMNVDMEAVGLNAIRKVATTAQNGLYSTARLQNFSLLQLMKRVAKVAQNQEEAQDILKSYLKNNWNFENLIRSVQLKEISDGQYWDESNNLVENNVNIIDSFFNWISNTETKDNQGGSPKFTKNVHRDNIVESREVKNDTFSNQLWNYKSANML